MWRRWGVGGSVPAPASWGLPFTCTVASIPHPAYILSLVFIHTLLPTLHTSLPEESFTSAP